MGELFLGDAANPPKILDSIGQIIDFFLKRITAQELNDFRNLGQRRPHPVLFPKIYRRIVNMKPEGKLALGKLQIEPSGLNVIAPRPQNIRVFLPMNRFFCL